MWTGVLYHSLRWTVCASGWLELWCLFKPAPSWNFVFLCPAPWVEEKLLLKTHDALSGQPEIYNGLGHETKEFHNNNFYLVRSLNLLHLPVFVFSLSLSHFKKKGKKNNRTQFHCFPVSSEELWAKLESLCCRHSRDGASGLMDIIFQPLCSLLSLRDCWLESRSTTATSSMSQGILVLFFWFKRHVWVEANIPMSIFCILQVFVWIQARVNWDCTRLLGHLSCYSRASLMLPIQL